MATVDDARRVLGLSADADAHDVRAARRRLARRQHPDAGGDAEAMRRINAAAAVLLADVAAQGSAPAAAQEATPEPDSRPTPAGAPAPRSAASPAGASPGRFVRDDASFRIEALPVDAYEALLAVASSHGETVFGEPGALLDVVLTDPLWCWCRLELLPDGGATIVALTVGAVPGEPGPDPDAVRDLWVGSLNRLSSA